MAVVRLGTVVSPSVSSTSFADAVRPTAPIRDHGNADGKRAERALKRVPGSRPFEGQMIVPNAVIVWCAKIRSIMGVPSPNRADHDVDFMIGA
jgi:hypothetical protein